jgi:transposase-like protein
MAKRYTLAEKVGHASRVIVGGESIAAVSRSCGATRYSVTRWVNSAAVRKAVAAARPPPVIPSAVAAGVIDEMTRARLRDAIQKPMPLSAALSYCRLSPDALDRWGELADAGDQGAADLLLDLRQWAAAAIWTLTDVVLDGASAGRGAQWLLARLWRDMYGESIEAAPERNGMDAYGDSDLDAIIAADSA